MSCNPVCVMGRKGMTDLQGAKEKKNTSKLQSELKHARCAEEFVQENQAELCVQSVAEYLNDMLISYNLEKSDVVKRAGFVGNYPYKIFNGMKNASRDKLVQIAFGFPLTLEETQQLLRLGGHSQLYVRDQRDAFLMFAIEKGYDMQKANQLLYENQKEILV